LALYAFDQALSLTIVGGGVTGRAGAVVQLVDAALGAGWRDVPEAVVVVGGEDDDDVRRLLRVKREPGESEAG